MERITDTHVFFWGSEFSNWFACKFYYKEKKFFNSEQAFMWEKAMFFKDRPTALKIADMPDPKRAKELGREVKNFNGEEWMKVCYDIMVGINFHKFASNPYLRDLLESTGDKTIVEASPTDSIWGIGLHWSDDRVLDESKWKGQNLLGKALMEVRKSLRESISFA
jgi:ribA/ribD-fused uncharacterized protein